MRTALRAAVDFANDPEAPIAERFGRLEMGVALILRKMGDAEPYERMQAERLALLERIAQERGK
jgi:hypothetical protein